MKFKTQLLIIIIIFLFPIILNAQQEIEVSEDSALISKGKQLGYAVYIPQGEFDDIKKDWSKLIRQNTKSKVEEVGFEINILGTQIEEIHHEPINLYSVIYQKDTAFLVIAFFEIDSVFFTFDENNKTLQSEKIYHGIKHFIRNFAVEQYKTAVQNELDEEEKTLKKLNKEFANLTKENENAHKEIQQNEQDTTNSKHAIITYERDNERKLEEINAKKESMASIPKGSDLEKEAKKELKGLEKDKKHFENNLEKERKNIVECNAKIEEMNLLIENNLKQQEEMKVFIEQQEEVVKVVTAKLNGIK